MSSIDRSGLRGVKLLDYLDEASTRCTHSLRASVNVLLHHVERVLRSQLQAWLIHGELLPGDGESADKFHCAACNKWYKNASQLANHEKSTKHKQTLAKVRQQQGEALSGLRELWSEVNHISRRLDQLDGKWL